MPLDPRQDGRTTALGSALLCADARLLAEERPRAYKDIDAVVGDAVGAGVAQVAAVMRPVVTYKC
jgi:release factor H-coupled RctB family protein